MAAQTNLGGFMKSILVKRLESSFYAFKRTLARFISSYEQFIYMCKSGDVFISKKVDVYDMLDSGDDDKLMELVEVDKVQHFKFTEFKKEFMPALEKDLAMLKRLGDAWAEIEDDPKLDQFKVDLRKNEILHDNRMIIFTESKETAEYLGKELAVMYSGKVVVFSGASSAALKREIEYSFNPKYTDNGEGKYSILITTDVLAEGINLHRSSVLVNYDLPWNPTRIMQRVGRINRVGTAFDRIYVFNFFPTAQTDKHLPLTERITQKLQAFHDTLGEDFKYLSEAEQVSSHKLYAELNASMDVEDSSNPELYYLSEIRRIRDEDTSLFDKIKRLPRKAKSGKYSEQTSDRATVTFLRKGYLKMFFKTDGCETTGITFMEAIKFIQSTPQEKRIGYGDYFFKHLNCNKLAFDDKLLEDDLAGFEKTTISGNDAKMVKLLKALSKCRKFTEIQEVTLQKMLDLWQNGEIPANITKDILKLSQSETDELQLFSRIYDHIPDRYFEGRNQKKSAFSGEKQVILSCYLRNAEVE